MAAVGAKEPLDVLQQMFNETLVHTGKAIRASQKNGPQNIVSAGGSSHGRMTDTMATYHLALNDVESEIVRAKAVLLRDLERLRAARMPVPSPQPQPPLPVATAPAPPAPAPTPTPASAPAPPAAAAPASAAAAAPPPPAAAAAAADSPAAPAVAQTKQPPAVMMEMPSTAAHSVSANPKIEAKDEAKRAAPFPDMGMGMGGDVVDLTASDNKSATVPVRPAPAAVAAAAAVGGAPARPGPPVARATAPVKPSPKPAPPPRAAASATPQPPPASTLGTVAQAAANPPQPSAAAPAAQNTSMEAMLSLPTTEAAGGAAMADMTGGELNFTNMEFSLAPAPDPPSQNAPPAPMADFDLSSFSAPQDGGNDLLSLDSFGTGAGPTNGQAGGATEGTANGTAAGNTASSTQPPADPHPSASDNVDSLFEMGGGDSMDLDLNLDDAGGMGESNFDDLFIPNDTDMGEFDDTYFNMD